MTKNNETEFLIENAARFHGHLGPFLVIGVRIGLAAKRFLQIDDENKCRLQASINTPLLTPFSCTIDGIQTSTGCTIGNQRLKIEASAKEISAVFNLQGSNKTIRVELRPNVAEALADQMSKGTDPERLVAEIAQMPEKQLLVLEVS